MTNSIGGLSAQRVGIRDAGEITGIAQGYKIDSLYNNASWLEADVILLGEQHDSKEIRQLNGSFISWLSKHFSLIVFVESRPSMQAIKAEEVSHIKKLFYIDEVEEAEISFFGWDQPVDDDFLYPSEIVEHLEFLDRKLDALKKRVELIHSRGWEAYGEELDQMIDDLPVKELRTLYEHLHLRARILSYQRSVEKAAEHWQEVESKIQETFPKRTEAQVATLAKVRKWKEEGKMHKNAKVIFIAGVAHLKTIPEQVSVKEFCLDRVYEELSLHKAVVMMPQQLERHWLKMTELS